MKFVTLLEETPQSVETRNIPRFGSYEDYGFRMLKPVNLPSDVSLSIQASYGHYCSPRKTLPVEDYIEMEVAIFKNKEWSSIEKVSTDEVLIAKFNGCSDGAGVYAYVPVELIEELYKELAN